MAAGGIDHGRGRPVTPAWGLFHPDPAVGFQVQLFFLACVAVAGLYGAATAKVQILFIQTVPALIAIGLLVLPRL